MRFFLRDQAEVEPCLLAARKLADGRIGLLTSEAELAEAGAHFRLHRMFHLRGEMLIGSFLRVHLVKLMLREEADLELARFLHLPGFGFEPAGDQLGEGRLAIAVGTQKRDAVIHVDAQIQVAQHRLAGRIADRAPLHRDDGGGEFLARLEGEARRMFLDNADDGLHLLQHLEAALRLPGLRCLGAETINEGLQMFALGFLLARHPGEKLHLLAPGLFEEGVVTGIFDELRLVEMRDLGHHIVQQVLVMADDDEGALIVA